jgi:phage tail sheath gpL-like
MSITFQTIPTTRIPGTYTEINTKAAQRGLPSTAQSVVLLGQKLTAGTATAGELVAVTSEDDAITLFGIGSMLHRMVLAALTADKNMGALYAVAAADAGGGVAATTTITVAVSSLTAGTLTLYVGGDALTLAILATDGANAIATALNALLADHPELPVAATVATNVVTVSAKNKGTLGNQIDFEYSYSGTGLTLTIPAMASGATDPTLSTLLDAVFTAAVDIIVCPWNTATPLGTVKTHLESRSDGVEQRGAVGVSAVDTTVSTAATLGSTVNDGRQLVALLEGTTSWAPEIAAAMAAVLAGEEDLARPLNGLQLKGIRPPKSTYRFTRGELATLLLNGVCPLIVNANEETVICRSVSTYVRNAAAASDDTLLDIQTIRVLDYVRKSIKARLDLRFGRVKIADVAHTENTTDCGKIRAEMLDVLFQLEAIDYVEAVEENKDDVVVERNTSDPTRVDAHLPSDVVNGLHVLATRIDLIL